jgi:hypothetical protein
MDGDEAGDVIADVTPPDRTLPTAGQLLHRMNTGAAERLTKRTIAAMRKSFTGLDHHPSEGQWAALAAVVKTMAEMAGGAAGPYAYLSALDPGVGKTYALIHFLRQLLASSDFGEVGVLVGIARLEQIRSIVSEANLSAADYAVYTSDEAMNALGRGHTPSDRAAARVLFTTHAMLERRLVQHRSFAEVDELQFRGRPRVVRVWDEALLPGKPLTVSRWQISRLLMPLARDHLDLVEDLEALADRIKDAAHGSQFRVPDLGEKHSVNLSVALEAMRGRADDEAVTSALWQLFDRVTTVRRNGRFGDVILDYRETFPDDFWPALILDASGRVRTLYRLWEARRNNLVRLLDGSKSYHEHTVHIWRTGGSKNAWRRNWPMLVDGIVATIHERSREKWLVVCHKPEAGLDVEREIRRRLAPMTSVRFTSWGRHDATNTYADIPNVILAGTLFLPRPALEALGRCAARMPSSQGPIDDADIKAVELGEHQHYVLQALCRGRVRKCEAGSCPPGTHTYIIASACSGISQTIGNILPGAKVEEWQPLPKRPKTPRPSSRKAKVLAALAEDESSLDEISAHSGLSRSTLKPILSRLVGKGEVKRMSRGRYCKARQSYKNL